ncbi:zinc-finger homeodomain 2-like [Olea europaea subsp. europaea]|uniref:Zinc-finger homeodomain 2-like n=1 Tax=Olea europaea subsp. europaea TaxID=158383 RepID=A0A8S0SZM2_OLEEU|nr:zinc-finger homeodomain 2-like [Olea europaea subsp. europaea]
MEFEDQEEEHEEEIGLAPTGYDSLGNSNSTRPTTKMPSHSTEAIPQMKPRYKECLKNHAVGIGGHSVDGCGEFMAAGAEGSMEALICAACNCHRNFHRKEAAESQQQRLLLAHHPQRHFGYTSPTGYLHIAAAPQQQQPRVAALPLPFTSGGGIGSRDELEDYYSNPSSSAGKKRFRTKFTAEQKEKMLNLAERLGWKMQKEDEELVQQFCNEVGVKRQVLKVWMHNNKQNLGKKT